MKTIRVAAMLVLGLTSLAAPAQEAAPPETAPAAKPDASTPSTDPKPGEERTFAGISFVWIPPGSFTMGSPEDEEGYWKSEGPQHEVTFAEGFWMGKYEVTQREWRAVMGKNPSFFIASIIPFENGDRLPVERVSWNDCQAFIQRLDEKSGAFRLPSEAEWEYACRAGTTTPFHFGEVISTEQANYCGYFTYGDGRKGVYRGKTMVVGSFPANAWGLYDMHGNVWEWCQDRYNESYARAPRDGSAWVTPASQYRVVRGGSYQYDPLNCRTACRNYLRPSLSNCDGGFRLVSSPPTVR